MRKLAALLFFSWSAFASSLTVDSRDISQSDSLTITVTLDNQFTSLETVPLRVDNLFVSGEPWVSTEFSWINGETRHRKVFRFRARPLQPGVAQVGPVVLRLADGQQETLPAIRINVIADRISASNDAEVVLRNLMAARREPLFVIAEIDRTEVFAGEPVNVTWWLYNAAAVQQWQITNVPKLDDFWSEERSRNERPERVYVNDLMMQRVPIRRATLFPLRSGRLRIGGLGIEAAVMRRLGDGPFAMFEGEMAEATYTSAALDLNVKAIPPGAPVDAVGGVTMTCEPPVQRNGGPVVLTVTVTGVSNLRAANPPRFASNVAGRVQREGGETEVTRDENAFGMQRQWRYLIFPAKAGTLELPPLTMRVFDPVTTLRRELKCGPWFVNAVTTPPAPVRETAPPEASEPPKLRWPWMLATALLLAVLALIPRLQRELAIRREARKLVRDATPAEIRARIEHRMHIDLHEQSDRGDAWRALRSLLDAAERDRDIALHADREIERRVREVLTIAPHR